VGIKRSAGAFFDPLVFVTAMTTLGLIVGILALAITYSGPAAISCIVIFICVVVGVLGIIVIALQMHAIVKKKGLRDKLTALYLEGREVTNQSMMRPSPENQQLQEEWRQRVIGVLSNEMESAHVMRFETSDLRVLVEFIKELGG
jgi:hypothetical protein